MNEWMYVFCENKKMSAISLLWFIKNFLPYMNELELIKDIYFNWL
jgi:hypothetical protein